MANWAFDVASEAHGSDRELEFVDMVTSHCSPLNGGALTCNCPTAAQSWDIFRALRPFVCPSHDRVSLRERLRTATLLSYDRWVDNIKTILSPDWASNPRTVCNHPSNQYFSLMHTVAAAITELGPWFPPAIRTRGILEHEISIEQRDGWFSFARDVAHHSARPYRHQLVRGILLWYQPSRRWGWKDPRTAPGSIFYTPFIHLFIRFHVQYCWFTRAQLERQRLRLLRQWLRIIKGSGEDLDEYGSIENNILHDPDLCIGRSVSLVQPSSRDQDRDSDVYPYFLGHRQVWYIIGFKFGPHIQDWEIWWNEPTDEFAGEFWKLVEDPPCHVPGQWYEDEEEYDLF